MEQRGLTQTELARRVGVTQGAIAKILNNNPGGSAHLHKIARELRTTPAYLEGEIDDPDLGAPIIAPWTEEQAEWLGYLESIDETNRAALLQVAKAMAGQATKPRTLHSPRQEYRGDGQ